MESYYDLSEPSNTAMSERQQLNEDSFLNGEKVLYDLLFSNNNESSIESKKGYLRNFFFMIYSNNY